MMLANEKLANVYGACSRIVNNTRLSTVDDMDGFIWLLLPFSVRWQHLHQDVNLAQESIKCYESQEK